jgi:hypothetical protein
VWILISIIILLALAYLWYRNNRKVASVTNLKATYLRKKGNMEQYRISWTLSPSTFVEKQQLFVGLDGASPSQFGADMSSSQSEIDIDLPTDSEVVLFVRTIGDNGKQADSGSTTFTATNEEPVQPAGTPTAFWLKHTA